MKKFMIAFKAIALGCTLFCVPQIYAQNWNLVWSDEFEGSGLPDVNKWSYDVGGSGWGNQESQYYTDARLENAKVENGALVITARKEAYQGNAYTSARLVTRGKGDWLYGKIEVKAKLPKGRGMWPAIWMLSTDWEYGGWPASGELDLMENVGYDSTVIHSNIHTQAYHHSINTNKGNSVSLADPWDTWHVYRMEWFADRVTYFVDDQQIFSFAKEYTGYTTWPFDKRFHLILNVAVGGSWGGAKGIDDTRFPQSMRVDYVRVYQIDGEPEPEPIAPPPGELVWNGDFSQDAKKWLTVGYFEGAFASGSLDGESYKINVQTAGTQNWHVQFSQAGLLFEQGKTYRVSFSAKSTVARSIAVAGNQHVDPWTTYGKDTLEIGTTMQDYSFDFTMNNATDNNARIEFDLGGVVSEIWLDNVSVMVVGTTNVQPFWKAPSIAPKLKISQNEFDLLGRISK